LLRVDSDRCTGCGACLEACPTDSIRLVDETAVINMDLCQECQACVDACPEGAIQSVGELLPVVEGEVVTLPERQLVVQRPVGVVTRSVRRPWLSSVAAALVFVGREIVPRVTVSLLEAWDRRQAATSSRAQPTADDSLSGAAQGAGGRRRRERQGRGR